MTDTKENDSNVDVAKIAPEALKASGEIAKDPEESGALEAPVKGFDPSGRYFVVKIDARYGLWNLIGFLEEAKDFLKFWAADQRRRAAEKSGLIKPEEAKKKGGFGRFNLFK